MTTPIARKSNTVQPMPPWTENPQLDERLWNAWKHKNKKRDEVRFARFVKAGAILVVVVVVLALTAVLL